MATQEVDFPTSTDGKRGYDGCAMTSVYTLQTQNQSPNVCRERDARICALLDAHPVTAAVLVRLGWFPTKSKALRRLGVLVRRGRIRLAGTVCRKPGRPQARPSWQSWPS